MKLIIKKSRSLALFIVGTHLAGLTLPWWADLHWAAALVVNGVVAISFISAFQRYVARTSPRAFVALELSGKGIMHVSQKDGNRIRVEEISSRWVNPLVTTMMVRLEDCRWPRKLVIPADAVEPEQFRFLRVQLLQRGMAS